MLSWACLQGIADTEACTAYHSLRNSLAHCPWWHMEALTTLTLPSKLIYRWGYSITVSWIEIILSLLQDVSAFERCQCTPCCTFFPLIILLGKWKPLFWELQVHSSLGRVNLCLFFFFWPHMGFQFPNQESNLGPLHWKFGVLTMDRQGSPCAVFLNGPFERSPPHCVLLSHKTTWYF